MRGLSPKIISWDSRRSKNAQTHKYKHTIPYMKFKLKLLQIKCHVHSEQASPISEGVAEIQINSHLAREIT
jgi:hypothetical protein